jgi:hypothetical protein
MQDEFGRMDHERVGAYFIASITYSFQGAGHYLKIRMSLSFSINILLSYGIRRFITMFKKSRHWTLS